MCSSTDTIHNTYPNVICLPYQSGREDLPSSARRLPPQLFRESTKQRSTVKKQAPIDMNKNSFHTN